MPVSNATFQLVRERAIYVCEYCDVGESETRGLLTVDHYKPESRGGSSDPNNLVYACFRCNLYKSARWHNSPDDVPIWNPRESHRSEHMVELPDGRMLALTDSGRVTITALRLNRDLAVSARLCSQQRDVRRATLLKLSDAADAIAGLGTDRSGMSDTFLDDLREQLRLLRAIDDSSGE